MNDRERSSWRSPALGERRTLDLAGGRLDVYESGQGSPIVFVHGLLVNANLWRKVIEPLSADFRCIALDMPLGSHRQPVGPGNDLSPPSIAALIGQALEALDLEDVTLVGNDTGGALCQMAVTTEPERIGRLVLTSCDFRDNFPPKAFVPLKTLVKAPGAIQAILGSLRPRAPRRLPLAFGWLTKRPIDPDAEDSYIFPSLVHAGIRADLRAALVQIDTSYTNAAADKLSGFDKPALIAWATEDKFFPPAHAEELARLLGDSRLEWIDDTYTFSPEDQPARLAELIAGFVREPARARVAA